VLSRRPGPHELGHLLFGFGRTVNPTKQDDWWFSLGLGIVYDRLVWQTFSKISSPLFDSLAAIWRNKFASRADIDQRLVNPDTSRDKSADHLIRMQTYGHGKSSVYLMKLRERIGQTRFDDVVKAYLMRPHGSIIEYDDFLTFFRSPEREIIRQLEDEFQVR
jgi:hypothetical protein